MLLAEGLHKRFGTVPALDGFELHVTPGEIAGLVGHNGAGKSTFAGVVAGLIRPDRGRVLVDGIDVHRSPGRASSRLGLSPQETALYLTATARQNLRLLGGLAGLRGATLRAAIGDTAEALQLTDLLDRPVGQLSGGQVRRVQLATALVHRPAVLVLDEPTTGADPGARQALLALVRSHADRGAAVCYTTHYLTELDDLGATVALAARGRVIVRGTREDLLAGLPGEVHLTLTDGEERVVRTTDPSRAVADLLAQGHRLRDVDLRRPGLDDLYRAVEDSRVRA